MATKPAPLIKRTGLLIYAYDNPLFLNFSFTKHKGTPLKIKEHQTRID